MLQWEVFPGVKLAVFRSRDRLWIYYLLGDRVTELLMRADRREEMQLCRKRFMFAFTYGEV